MYHWDIFAFVDFNIEYYLFLEIHEDDFEKLEDPSWNNVISFIVRKYMKEIRKHISFDHKIYFGRILSRISKDDQKQINEEGKGNSYFKLHQIVDSLVSIWVAPTIIDVQPFYPRKEDLIHLQHFKYLCFDAVGLFSKDSGQKICFIYDLQIYLFEILYFWIVEISIQQKSYWLFHVFSDQFQTILNSFFFNILPQCT